VQDRIAGVVRLVSKIGITTVVVLAVAGLSAFASVATSTTERPDPRELWNAYPLEPGQGKPKVRLPADSAPPSRAPARSSAAGDEGDDGGGAGASVAALLGVALLALALGAVGGLRLRRSSRSAPEPSAAPTAGTAAPAPAPAPRAVPPPPPRSSRAPSLPIPSPSPSMVSTSPRAPSPAPPPPSPSPPRAPTPAPRAHAPAPAQPPRPATPRFRRVAWPAGAENGWRCEVASHFGVRHADFRALALAPGKRRPIAFARTPSYTRPGWGSELSFQEQSAMVDELVATLRRAGWEHVGVGREWFAARFVWTGSEAPDLDEFPDPLSAKERADVR
jgi:hypothetical protein